MPTEKMLFDQLHLPAVKVDQLPAFLALTVKAAAALPFPASDVLEAGRAILIDHILLYKTRIDHALELPVYGARPDGLSLLPKMGADIRRRHMLSRD